jgi:class 3 adenylate cyclase
MFGVRYGAPLSAPLRNELERPGGVALRSVRFGGGRMAELPTGTVTFLFTDLESSTLLWEEHSDAMQEALARHDAILHAAIEDHDGTVFATMGDGVAAAFSTAADALRAVLEAQQRLQAEEWGATGPLRARMGLHTDEGRLRGPDEYVNRPLNRCARLMAIAHGGQMLLSDSTATLVRDALPPEADLVDLGEYQLRDLAARMHVFQVVHPDLRSEFPPLRSLDVLPGNLPRQVTTFVGREEEVSALARLLRERSLVTLTGVGGVGKTRLAVQVGAEVVPEFPDGAWLCELAPVTDPSAIWDALAACLGVKPSAGKKPRTNGARIPRPETPAARTRQLRAPTRPCGAHGRGGRAAVSGGDVACDQPGGLGTRG